MPESTLALDYDEILAQCCVLAHGVRDTSRLSAEAVLNLNSAIKSGYRKFLFPAQVTPGLTHSWSFLKPSFSFPIETGITDYELPPDWGGILGPMQFSAADNVWNEVQKQSVEMILRRRGNATEVTSQPQFYAERAKANLGLIHQRWEILIWPTPDTRYTLTGQYRVHPNAMTDVLQFPYGGVEHGETILEGCLAEVEQRLLREPGVHTSAFMSRLATSIAYDQTEHAAVSLGYNSDPSFGQRRQKYGVPMGNMVATINGVLYDE